MQQSPILYGLSIWNAFKREPLWINESAVFSLVEKWRILFELKKRILINEMKCTLHVYAISLIVFANENAFSYKKLWIVFTTWLVSLICEANGVHEARLCAHNSYHVQYNSANN